VWALAAVDGEASPAEEEALRDLCADIALSAADADAVIAQPFTPDDGGLRELLLALSGTDLPPRLVEDMVRLGFSDGRYDAAERRMVRALATLMVVGEDDVARIEDAVVEELELLHDARDDLTRARDLSAATTVAAGLVGGGVASGVVAALLPSGSHSVAAIVDALAVLGADGGPVVGGAVLAVIAVGTAALTKLVYRQILAAPEAAALR
jgi:uncharacterized tellurite resistance protein B-like protein